MKKEFQPYFKRNQTQETQKKARGGWDEDDDNTSNLRINKNAWNMTNNKTGIPSYQDSSYTQQSSKSGSVTQNTESSGFIEEKLINDLTKPTGVSYNPSESQLKEIGKRSKNLNSNNLYELLLNKIYNFQNVSDNNELKTICKSLYVINTLIKENQEVNELFQENISLFVEINSYFAVSNKKIFDISKSVLTVLDYKEENQNQEYHSDHEQGQELEQEEEKPKKQFNFIKKKANANNTQSSSNTQGDLIDFGDSNDDKNKNKQTELSSVKHIDDIFSESKAQNNVDLLNIESSNSTVNVSTSTNILDLIANNTGNADVIDFSNTENSAKVEKKAKLNDLLYQLNLNEGQVSNTDKKPGKEESSGGSEATNQLSFFYAGQPGTQGVGFSPNLTGEKVVLCKSSENFDYEKVYGKTEEKEKDSFGFVNDMLKTNK
mmetsp:Transcript_6778/g.7030  ORF Transcript_6778/g.7030 Transcript_6778/m.7030 type:complete len:433 (-) Transcript_6778:58-1356(-)